MLLTDGLHVCISRGPVEKTDARSVFQQREFHKGHWLSRSEKTQKLSLEVVQSYLQEAVSMAEARETKVERS